MALESITLESSIEMQGLIIGSLCSVFLLCSICGCNIFDFEADFKKRVSICHTCNYSEGLTGTEIPEKRQQSEAIQKKYQLNRGQNNIKENKKGGEKNKT